MRLFLITWIGKEFGLAEVVKALKQKHEIVYWVGAHSREIFCLTRQAPNFWKNF